MQPEHWPKLVLIVLAALADAILGHVLRLLLVADLKSGQFFTKEPPCLSFGWEHFAKLKILVEATVHAWLDTSAQLTDNMEQPEGEVDVHLLAWTIRHRGSVQMRKRERTNLLGPCFSVLEPYYT